MNKKVNNTKNSGGNKKKPVEKNGKNWDIQ